MYADIEAQQLFVNVFLRGQPEGSVLCYNVSFNNEEATSFGIDMISPRVAHDLEISFEPDGTPVLVSLTYPNEVTEEVEAVVYESGYDLALRSLTDPGQTLTVSANDDSPGSSNDIEPDAGNDSEPDAAEDEEPDAADENLLFHVREATISPNGQDQGKIVCRLGVENEPVGGEWEARLPQDECIKFIPPPFDISHEIPFYTL